MDISTVIEDLYAQQAEFTAKAITEPDFERWIAAHAAEVARLEALAREIEAAPPPDLAILTVATRAVRGFLSA